MENKKKPLVPFKYSSGVFLLVLVLTLGNILGFKEAWSSLRSGWLEIVYFTVLGTAYLLFIDLATTAILNLIDFLYAKWKNKK